MDSLSELVKSYFEAGDFNILDAKDNFIVVDKGAEHSDRDTRVVWIVNAPSKKDDLDIFEESLLTDFESTIPQYSDARFYMLTPTTENFTKSFRSEAVRLQVKIRVPIQFFDAPFKSDDAPKETRSAINELRNSFVANTRVPQPYSEIVNGVVVNEGEDLIDKLIKDFKRPENACFRVVVGPAGSGKSVLYQATFSLLYDRFIKEKNRQKIFPRPTPFVPEYLRKSIGIRTRNLIRNFLNTEVAALVPETIWEWMLVNGYGMWLFDGLDELYAGDDEFFDYLLDLLTRPNSKARLLICARDSLLKSVPNFAQFLNDFSSSSNNDVKVYKLNGWGYNSKRQYAWIRIENTPPEEGTQDTTRVKSFMSSIEQGTLANLTKLPYYCKLMVDEYLNGVPVRTVGEFELIENTIKNMVLREKDKSLLTNHMISEEDFMEWLETIAFLSMENNFASVNTNDIDELTEIALQDNMTPDDRENAIISLRQFALFAPGLDAGTVKFEHELLAEYLAGKYLLSRLETKPSWVAKILRSRIDLPNTLVGRLISNKLTKQLEKRLIWAMTNEPLSGKAFSTMLQLLMMANKSKDVVKANRLNLEGRNLCGIRFNEIDLADISFRNADLTNATFSACNLLGTKFEGARFSGTRFEKILKGHMKGAQFGSLERFEAVFIDSKRIDDVNEMVKWVNSITGETSGVIEPCAASKQLKNLWKKYVHLDGSGRRDELDLNALTRGGTYEGAPTPEECLEASIRFGFISRPSGRNKYKRASGDKYKEMVLFVRDQELSERIRKLLNTICKDRGCQHIKSNIAN